MDERRGLSRRRALQAGAAAAAAAGIGGIGGWTSAASAATLRRPGSLPYPDVRPGTDTLPQIQQIVVLMQENHSYDNRLGMLRRRGADGFRFDKGKPTNSNPYKNGDIQHAFHMPTTCQPSGFPTQEWEQSHIQWNHGRNDGFVKSGSGPVAMGYWDERDQPFYYSMAKVFPIADRYFCSVLGQTYPNRRYLIAATSMGMVDDQLDLVAKQLNPPNGTIFESLSKQSIAWKNYYSTTSTLELYLDTYLSNQANIVKIDEFFTDAKNGTLPPFSLVEPNYNTQSEEDPQNIVVGEQFAAKVIDAVMTSPQWSSTLLIWTYDEHGGYYDHVAPPKAIAPDDLKPILPKGDRAFNGFSQYGFRVPSALISPWARADYVSHRVMDHTSILALVEAKWNLPALTRRDANAWPMLDMLDLTAPAFAEPPKLAKPLLDTDHSALACNKSGPGVIPPKGSVTKPHRH